MGHIMKWSGHMDNSLDLENIFGLMGRHIMDIGAITLWMGLAFSLLKTDANSILASLSRIADTDMEYIKWKTDKFILDTGDMEKPMDLVALNNLSRKLHLGSGKMGNSFNGSIMKLSAKYKTDKRT